MPNKSDCEELKASVERRRISGLFHYTPVAALCSVFLSGGILCREELARRNTEYCGHGWGREGKEEEFKGYICCGFIPPWGMLRRDTEPQAIIEIQPRVIWQDGTIFCPDNSAYNQFTLENLRTNTTLQHFDQHFRTPTASRASANMAEVLVKDAVVIEDFLSIHFIDDATRNSALEELRKKLRNVELPLTHPIELHVTPGHFPPQMRPIGGI